jgi:DNA polymerase-4
VGAASNGYLAKLVCNSAKPNGAIWLKDGNEASFMLELSLSDLYLVGPSTLKILNQHRIFTVTDLQNTPLDRLASQVGNNKAHVLSLIAHGQDPYNRTSHQSSHSISRERTFLVDTQHLSDIHAVLLDLSHELFQETLALKLTSYTLSLKLRTAEFKTVQKQCTKPQPFTSSATLYQEALRLLTILYKPRQTIRLIGLALKNVQKKSGNNELFLAEESDIKREAIENTVLNLKKKGISLTKASVLGLRQIKTLSEFDERQ